MRPGVEVMADDDVGSGAARADRVLPRRDDINRGWDVGHRRLSRAEEVEGRMADALPVAGQHVAGWRTRLLERRECGERFEQDEPGPCASGDALQKPHHRSEARGVCRNERNIEIRKAKM